MEALKPHRAIWILAVLHFALAGAMAWLTPYRTGGNLVHQGGAYAPDIGAPDERQHANYVARLLRGEGVPTLDPKDPNLYETYQSHQPPAYYFLAAGVAKVFGGTTLETRSEGLTLRFLNGAIGAAAVSGVYFFVLWGFRRPAAALAAGAFAALLPMNVALSGAISNDPMLFALCTWSLALMAKGIREGFNYKIAGGVGVLMGLAFVTKTTAVALIPAVAVGFAMARPSKSDVLRFGGTAALAALAFGVPWWLRNLSVYGDPLAISAFNAAFTGSPQAADYLRFPGGGIMDYWVTGSVTGTGVAWWTLRSFFGVFGYMDIFLYGPAYPVFGLLLLAIVVARVVSLFRDPDEDSKPVRWMGSLFFWVVVALFLRFNQQYFQGQARYLLPAIAPIAATVGLGIYSLVRPKVAPGLAAAWTLAGILLMLNVYALLKLPEEFSRRADSPIARAELRDSGLR